MDVRTNRPKAGTCQHVRIGDGHFTYVTLGGQEDQLKPGPRAASTLTMGGMMRHGDDTTRADRRGFGKEYGTGAFLWKLISKVPEI